MGVIIKNNIVYSGEGGDSFVEITQAEYDALPDTKNSNNVNYLITDAEGGGGGSSIELDTTLSIVGMAADAKAVGDAIAELRALIDNINIKYVNTEDDMIQIKDSAGTWYDYASGGLTIIDLSTLTLDDWTFSTNQSLVSVTTKSVNPFYVKHYFKAGTTSNYTGYVYAKTVKAYDLTGKNYMDIYGSWSATYGQIQFINEETGNTDYTYKPGTQPIDKHLLPDLNGKYYIRICNGVYYNSSGVYGEMTINTLKFTNI